MTKNDIAKKIALDSNLVKVYGVGNKMQIADSRNCRNDRQALTKGHIMKSKKENVIYAYRLTRDTGSAPCVHNVKGENTGLLTLACCKGGQIRNGKGIKTGLRYCIGNKFKDKIDNDQADVYLMGIFKNRLLYVAKITKIISMANYFAKNSPYKNRHDYIYEFTPGGIFKRNNVNECFHPKTEINRHKRDQLGEYVILSTCFAYWGSECKEICGAILAKLPKRQESKCYNCNSAEGGSILRWLKKCWDFKQIIQNKPNDAHYEDTSMRCGIAHKGCGN